MSVTCTEEADLVEAIAYLNARSSTAAVQLDADISRCIARQRRSPQ